MILKFGLDIDGDNTKVEDALRQAALFLCGTAHIEKSKHGYHILIEGKLKPEWSNFFNAADGDARVKKIYILLLRALCGDDIGRVRVDILRMRKGRAVDVLFRKKNGFNTMPLKAVSIGGCEE